MNRLLEPAQVEGLLVMDSGILTARKLRSLEIYWVNAPELLPPTPMLVPEICFNPPQSVALSPVHTGDEVEFNTIDFVESRLLLKVWNRQQIGHKVDCCRYGRLYCRFQQEIGNNLNSTVCRGRLCCRYGRLCCWYGRRCCWYGWLCCWYGWLCCWYGWLCCWYGWRCC